MLGYIDRKIVGIAAPVLLLLTGIYFTLKLRGFFLIHPIKTLKSMRYKKKGSGTSPFRAMCLALAGTLGVGNIVGVASAISFGGAGAVFWMWVSAPLAMTLKYCEIVLAVRYRKSDGKRSFGGAVYYIKEAFSKMHLKTVGYVVSVIFGLLCIVNSLSMGCVMQVNAISDAVSGVFSISPLFAGIAVSALIFVSVVGDGDRVGKISEIAVPIASVLYIIAAVLAIMNGSDRLLYVIYRIIHDAFDLRSVGGGIIGILTSRSLRYGIMRGLISNEAGCGTAPTAHACADTDSPHRQGLYGLIEVFVDTVVLCSLTAFVILIFGIDTELSDPMKMCMDAFCGLLGGWAEYFICAEIFVFAFATLICWAHYGKESVRYFTQSKHARNAYIALFCLLAVVGAVSSSISVWEAADICIGIMTLINLSVLMMLSREICMENNIGIKAVQTRGI